MSHARGTCLAAVLVSDASSTFQIDSFVASGFGFRVAGVARSCAPKTRFPDNVMGGFARGSFMKLYEPSERELWTEAPPWLERAYMHLMDFQHCEVATGFRKWLQPRYVLEVLNLRQEVG